MRLVGDRSIPEEEFEKVIKNRSTEIGYWTGKLEEKLEIIKDAYVPSNNHFQGFGPAAVNLFRRSTGLEPADWTANTGQKTLFGIFFELK